MNELYENEDQDRPIEPELGMTLGDDNISQTQHSTYVKRLCTIKNMNEMKSERGWNSRTCRKFVCPNEDCLVHLKLTLTISEKSKQKSETPKRKWHVVSFRWEHIESCEYREGIKNPSTEVINVLLSSHMDTKDLNSQEKVMNSLKNLGVNTDDTAINSRIKAALRARIKAMSSSTTLLTTSSSHGKNGFTSSSSSSSTIGVDSLSLESSTSCTSQSVVTVSNIVFILIIN